MEESSGNADSLPDNVPNETKLLHDVAGEACSLLLTLTTAQERMLLDYSDMGIIKLQNSKIVYANKKAVQLCRCSFVDDLLYKSREHILSELACQVLDEWMACNPYLPALDSVKSIKPAEAPMDVDTWIMHSVFHGEPCIQLMFLADETDRGAITGEAKESDEKNTIELVSYALKNNHFRILFQPIACLTGGNEAHYDVMLRMLTEERGEVSAGEFMGDIDTHQLAVKVDRWVILQAIKSVLLSQKQGKRAHLFIHLSSASVLDQTLPPWLFQVIKKSSIQPEALIFQISESTVVQFKKESHRLLRSTRNMGCLTNICHFGLTNKPLESLQEMDCDYVKLHNAFTRELVDNRNSEQDVRELVQKLHAMNLKTIVPHVETPNVMTQLWRCGVDYVQGYFLQRPRQQMDYDFSSDS